MRHGMYGRPGNGMLDLRVGDGDTRPRAQHLHAQRMAGWFQGSNVANPHASADACETHSFVWKRVQLIRPPISPT